jgi:hypothetical protein
LIRFVRLLEPALDVPTKFVSQAAEAIEEGECLPNNPHMVDVTERLDFTQNLFDVVGRQQTDFLDGVEALLEFVTRFDDLSIASFALFAKVSGYV